MASSSAPYTCTESAVLTAVSMQGQHAKQPGPERVGRYLDHDAVPMCQIWLNEHPEYVIEEAQRQQDTGNLHSISRTWSEMLSKNPVWNSLC
jgi:hypothetical protein